MNIWDSQSVQLLGDVQHAIVETFIENNFKEPLTEPCDLVIASYIDLLER